MTDTNENISTEEQIVIDYQKNLFMLAVYKSDEVVIDGNIDGEKFSILEAMKNEKKLHPENQIFSEQDLDDYVTSYKNMLQAEKEGDAEKVGIYSERLEGYQTILQDIINYPESTIKSDVLDEINTQVNAKIEKERQSNILGQETKELETKITKFSAKAKQLGKTLKKKLTVGDHLYPVELVEKWTEKLHHYNEQIDIFIADINNVSPNISMEWLKKIVHQFVKRINFALALLRYYIVKALWGMLKKVREQVQYIAPIILSDGIKADENGITILPPGHWVFTGQIWKVVGVIISWIKAVIKWFVGPYLILIQFAIDFMTYTPPLVTEAATLLAKVISVPPLVLSKLMEIASKTVGSATTTIGSELVQIKMQPITFQELMDENPPEKPTYAEFSDISGEYTELKTKKQQEVNEVRDIWNKYIAELKSQKIESEGYVPNVTKENVVYKNQLYYMYKPEKMSLKDGYEIAWKIFGSKKLLDYTVPAGKNPPKDTAPLVGNFSTLKNDVRKALKVSQLPELLSGSLGEEVYKGLYNYLLDNASGKKNKTGKEYYDFILNVAKEVGMTIHNMLYDMNIAVIKVWSTNKDMRKMEVRSWRN